MQPIKNSPEESPRRLRVRTMKTPSEETRSEQICDTRQGRDKVGHHAMLSAFLGLAWRRSDITRLCYATARNHRTCNVLFSELHP
ncbi:hypothetical protein E2C01_040003 [Portunus trituberculatus]|uniref:Uncharacterized protein n=1 Tax=Portunus trituberculatus TaxID=210409 RepID=A0A5B7FLT7_PORTR|nr:hypothetical protein [Portunus trituberculatus]